MSTKVAHFMAMRLILWRTVGGSAGVAGADMRPKMCGCAITAQAESWGEATARRVFLVVGGSA